MKKTFLFLFVALLFTSCEGFLGQYTFKVKGSGSFLITMSDNTGTHQWTSTATEFKTTLATDEVYVLSAQSQNGTGVTVEAWIGNEKINSRSSNGYGVASISGSN